ncbi:NUDIX hydrolase, partial [Corynebacterium nasicanis]
RVDARGRTGPVQPGRSAAVLMLFSGADHLRSDPPRDAAVLLTHRSPTMRSHSGQIAFPGGRIDTTDLNPVDAALREAWEETGLDRSSVTPVAELEPVHIQASGYPVHPVLGHWHTPGEVGVASPAEADDVFPAYLADLVDPRNRLMVGWSGWTGPAFTINDYLVWGFTAGLLSALLHQGGWEEDWDRETTLDLQDTLAKSRNNEPHYSEPGNRVRFLR